jgi:hypothetical protein
VPTVTNSCKSFRLALALTAQSSNRHRRRHPTAKSAHVPHGLITVRYCNLVSVYVRANVLAGTPRAQARRHAGRDLRDSCNPFHAASTLRRPPLVGHAVSIPDVRRCTSTANTASWTTISRVPHQSFIAFIRSRTAARPQPTSDALLERARIDD